MKIAIQGITGSFHDIAARKYYGMRYPDRALEITPCESFADTFNALSSGNTEAAMVAIENTIAGSILGNYGLLERSGAHIVGEVYVRIQHHLVALPGQRLSDIHTVWGHPVAIPQCDRFFRAHPNLKVMESSDTASAAKRIQDESLKGVAAIAGYAAADLYRLAILAERIEDQEKNYTRFLALSREPNALEPYYDKATVNLKIPHRSGALAEALAVLKHNHINLTKIQSVPLVDAPFEYAIILDLTWEDIRDFRNAIQTLEGRSLEIRTYGVYRHGESDVEATGKANYHVALEVNEPEPKVESKEVPPSKWQDWGIKPNAHQPDYLVISGPCSAETPEQLMEAAEAVAATGWVSVLRAGIWKPRTRAGGFEGNGIEALKWLREVRAKTGLPVAVEVAGAAHVEAALAHDVDIVWIGARTTGNPFSVQEIAESLRGTKIPVLVKNPISPDVDLWIGALERLALVGLSRLGAIHRGFASADKAGLRNPPLWNLALQFKAKLPQIPLICDPSHITGDRSKLSAISQRAVDLGMQGLMIESHPNPDEAWTDAAQQITAAALDELLLNLTWRPTDNAEEGLSPENWIKLETLRTAIDRLDHEMVELLASRFDVVRQIGSYKAAHGIDVLQPERWSTLMERRLAHGERLGLHDQLVEGVFNEVHKESIRTQSSVDKE